jgi:hypothetical protein
MHVSRSRHSYIGFESMRAGQTFQFFHGKKARNPLGRRLKTEPITHYYPSFEAVP